MSQAVGTNPASSTFYPTTKSAEGSPGVGWKPLWLHTPQVGKANGICPCELSSLRMDHTFLSPTAGSSESSCLLQQGFQLWSTCWNTEQLRFKTEVEPSRAREVEIAVLTLLPLPSPTPANATNPPGK